MRATVFIDVLSHWCLAAVPAIRVLTELTPNVEIVLAPIKGNAPAGYTNEMMRWWLERGALAYGRKLRADWCEGPQTTSWFANAIASIGGEENGEPLRAAHAVMSGALEQGLKLGRADECFEFMARYLKTNASEIGKRVADPALAAKLDGGNRRLREAGADERPTFLLEGEIGDRALLKGLWQKELVAAAGLAILHDERAYTTAGPPPF